MPKRIQITPRAKADRSLVKPKDMGTVGKLPPLTDSQRLGRKLGRSARKTYAKSGQLK